VELVQDDEIVQVGADVPRAVQAMNKVLVEVVFRSTDEQDVENFHLRRKATSSGDVSARTQMM